MLHRLAHLVGWNPSYLRSRYLDGEWWLVLVCATCGKEAPYRREGLAARKR